MKIGRFNVNPLDVLLLFVPVAIVLEVVHAGPVWIFGAACLAIIPLAGWMGKATEHLASRFGAGIGGLLNATFGNAAEMIIAVFALSKGLTDLVKASLTGSIIGNVLLVLGLSLLLGGFRHTRQKFNATAAGMGATLLAISAIGLVAPAVYAMIPVAEGTDRPDPSLAIAIVLIATYGLSLWFSLRTHSHLFAPGHGDGAAGDGEAHWSARKSVGVLLGATALIALMSEFLVGSAEATAEKLGMSEVFVGVILVAIIGNAAEHSSAVLMAMRNRMDLCLNIAIGSGLQIALFVAPALLFLSYAIGPAPMDLMFSPFEVVAVAFSVVVVAFVAYDGESHWMEGVMLLSAYVIVGIIFYCL